MHPKNWGNFDRQMQQQQQYQTLEVCKAQAPESSGSLPNLYKFCSRSKYNSNLFHEDIKNGKGLFVQNLNWIDNNSDIYYFHTRSQNMMENRVYWWECRNAGSA